MPCLGARVVGRDRIPIAVTRSLFAVTGALWLVVAALIGTRAISIGPVSGQETAVLVAVMTLAALVMEALALWSLRGNRWVDAFAVGVAVVNVLLTVTDQVGVYDAMYFALSVALLVVLLWALMAGRTSRQTSGEVRDSV